MTTNHYRILGLPCGIEATKLSQKEITKAYRILARQMHPDKQTNDPNATKNFQRLLASYEVLNDEKERKKYDYHLLTLYQPFPRPIERDPQQSVYAEYTPGATEEMVSFHVSWRVGEGLCDYSADRLRELFSRYGRVENVMLLKNLDGTRMNALVSIFMPTIIVWYVQVFAIGDDPSNLLRVEVAEREDYCDSLEDD